MEYIVLSVHQEPRPPSLLCLLPSPICSSSPKSTLIPPTPLSTPRPQFCGSVLTASRRLEVSSIRYSQASAHHKPKSKPARCHHSKQPGHEACLTPQKINKSDSDAYCSGHSQNQWKDFKSLSTEQLAGYKRPRYVSGKAGQGWKSERMKERANNQELPRALGHTVSSRRQVPNCMVILTHGGGGRESGWEEKGPEGGSSAGSRVSPQMGGVLHTHLLTSPMANFICKCLNLSKVSTGCLKPQGEF